VLDCGQSTGGFTDFALQKGARFVIGIEVGIDQLDLSLKGNPRVKTFEKLNVLEAYEKVPSEYLNDGAVDIAIADVSFVSLLHVLPGILKFKPLEMLLLIKPQFELSKKDLSKSGLVKDKGLAHRRVLDVANTIGQKSDLQLIDTIPSPILGSDGNQEYFAYFKDPQK
jgi:23S rRNA (cytidine1920-2'-O)/16S rRNA (cytidine1409-2'-O)-methyltransferase